MGVGVGTSLKYQLEVFLFLNSIVANNYETLNHGKNITHLVLRDLWLLTAEIGTSQYQKDCENGDRRHAVHVFSLCTRFEAE